MRSLRVWTAVGVALGLCGVGLACRDAQELPSAQEREVRSEVLRDLISSRERTPEAGELEAQGRDLQVAVGGSGGAAQGGSGPAQATASITGRVEWVGDDEVLFQDEQGGKQEVRVVAETRFVTKGRETSRHLLEEGSRIRVTYEVRQGEWLAHEVELLRKPFPLPSGEGRGEGSTSPSIRAEPR
jgi:hypothetical protein